MIIPPPLIDVIVLNWNGREDTLACMESLHRLDYKNFRIVLVDNGSVDGSVPALRVRFPNIHILENGANLGYAGGNNVGIRWSLTNGADYILLLNNDTVVAPDLLSAFCRGANVLPPGSVIGAAILYFDKPDALWFGGISWCNERMGFKTKYRNQPISSLPADPIESDYITGCALFAPASTFQATGYLDEDFFLTYEETDWCFRARKLGFRCFVTREAIVWHKVSASFGGAGSPLVRYFMVRNRLLWGRHHLGLRQRLRLHLESCKIATSVLYEPLHLSAEVEGSLKRLRWGVSSWLRALSRKWNSPFTRADLYGLRDYYLGRFGDCPAAMREIRAR